jgi:hypothetical protein
MGKSVRAAGAPVAALAAIGNNLPAGAAEVSMACSFSWSFDEAAADRMGKRGLKLISPSQVESTRQQKNRDSNRSTTITIMDQAASRSQRERR